MANVHIKLFGLLDMLYFKGKKNVREKIIQNTEVKPLTVNYKYAANIKDKDKANQEAAAQEVITKLKPDTSYEIKPPTIEGYKLSSESEENLVVEIYDKNIEVTLVYVDDDAISEPTLFYTLNVYDERMKNLVNSGTSPNKITGGTFMIQKYEDEEWKDVIGSEKDNINGTIEWTDEYIGFEVGVQYRAVLLGDPLNSVITNSEDLSFEFTDVKKINQNAFIEKPHELPFAGGKSNLTIYLSSMLFLSVAFIWFILDKKSDNVQVLKNQEE